jgi:ABC-type nitrate/sulfonate/bicarbonate transport system permease component
MAGVGQSLTRLRSRPHLSWIGQASWQATRRMQPYLIAAVCAMVAWELLGRWLSFPFLPPFTRVLMASWELLVSGKILGNLAASLLGLTLGYALAVVAGITIGTLMGRYRMAEHLLDPYLTAGLASPTLVYLPILFALFGVSRAAQVAVVFLYAVFIIIVNTMTGIRTVDTDLLEMGRSFGASERQLFWKVMLPASLPTIMAGLRLGMGRAVKGMINSEMFIALFGLGALIKMYGGRFDAERVLGILLYVVALALIGTGIVQLADRRLTSWCD